MQSDANRSQEVGRRGVNLTAMGIGRVVAFGLVALISCGHGDRPPDGTEGGHCYPNRTCNAGLVCLSDLCVNPGVDASTADAMVTRDGPRPDGALEDAPTADAAPADAGDARVPDATPPDARVNYALEFTATSGMSLSSTSPLAQGTQSTFTAEFWVKFSALTGTQDLMNIHNASNKDLYVEIQGNTVYCNFLTQPAVSFSGLATDTWYDIACSKDTASLRLFVNGELKDTGSWTGDVLVDDYMTVSGFESKYLNAMVDEVRLSTAAYSATFAPETHFTADVNTILLWHLDEGSGSTSADDSGNGHDATLGMLGSNSRGSPTWVLSDR